MIIIRTPLRVSFLGGGTDHPAWFEQHSGAVLSTTINKYVYLQMRELPEIFEHNYHVAWRIIEEVKNVKDIVHPVVREVLLNYFSEAPQRFEIIYNADLPSRSGLASSSAFTVALLQGLWAYHGKIISQAQLSQEAIHVEQNLLKEPVGCQDQIAVAHGGLNKIHFATDGSYQITPLPLLAHRRQELESHMMLFFTGFQRSAGEIEAEKVKNFSMKEASLHRLYDMVQEGQDILLDNSAPIASFGELLDEGWHIKRALSPVVSNGPIDDAYDAAKKAGASGGKLLGAGGGGFLMFIVPPAKQNAVRQALKQFKEVPVQMENRGSHVVLYEPFSNEANQDLFSETKLSANARV